MPRTRIPSPFHAPDAEAPTAAGPANDSGATTAGELAPPVSLTGDARAALLDIARVAVGVAVGATAAGSIADARSRHGPIGRHAAAFVTLTEDGELRGCVGHMDAGVPVEDSVIAAAMSASLDDPRFAPVAPKELPLIHLEVSVLGAVVPLADPQRMRLGVDGIIVQRGGRRGLLLPEVAPMLGNSRAAMFETACRKAGLPGDAWQDPGTRLFAFRTDRFGGPAVVTERAAEGSAGTRSGPRC